MPTSPEPPILPPLTFTSSAVGSHVPRRKPVPSSSPAYQHIETGTSTFSPFHRESPNPDYHNPHERYHFADSSNSEDNGKANPADPYQEKDVVPEPSRYNDCVERLDKWWALEFASLLLSVGSIGAIVGLLSHYDGRPLYDWQHSITLNAVISFLAGISKSSLALVLNQALGQLKWSWFATRSRRGRKLVDLQTFDSASRGPYGSTLLLFFHGFRFDWASLAASITIVCLAFEPFVQQAVTNPTRDTVTRNTAGVNIASEYNGWYSNGVAVNFELEFQMRAAINTGLFYDNLTGTQVAPIPSCSTGNCTFPKYASLAVCTKCVNVTHLLTIPDHCKSRSSTTAGSSSEDPDEVSDCWYTTPNGMNMTQFARYNLPYVALKANGSMGRNDHSLDKYRAVLANVTAASSVYGLGAMDCIFHLCAKVYDSSVRIGAFEEQVATELYPSDDADNIWTTQPIADLKPFLDVPPDLLPLGVNKSVQVSTPAKEAMGKYLTSILNGNISNYGPYPQYSSDVIGAMGSSIANYTHRFENVATAMTNYMRTQSTTGHGTPQFLGDTHSEEVYIHIRWFWLILPLVLLLLSVLLLLGTIIDSAHHHLPSWKVSILPILLHKMVEEKVNELATASTAEMETLAAMFRGRLGSVGLRFRLMPIGAAGEGTGLLSTTYQGRAGKQNVVISETRKQSLGSSHSRSRGTMARFRELFSGTSKGKYEAA